MSDQVLLIGEEMATEKDFAIHFPDYFDDFAGEIEAKGYFADLIIEFGGRQIRPVIYDAARLRQEYEDALKAPGVFAVPSLIVVHSVTRWAITSAIEVLAAGKFRDLLAPAQ